MPSWVEIANAALVDICGVEPIIALDDPNSANARACQARLQAVVDAVLRDHPWNCATRWALLPAAAEAPLSGWQRRFPWPSDPWCLRVLRVGSPAAPLDAGAFGIEGRAIDCDEEAPLPVQMVVRVTDPMLLDAALAEAIGARLAHAVGYKVTGSKDTQQRAWAYYDTLLRSARSIDGQECPPAPPRSSFLEARW